MSGIIRVSDPEVKRVVAELSDLEYSGELIAVAIVAVIRGKPLNDMRIMHACNPGTRYEVNIGVDVLKRTIIETTMKEARKG